MNDQPYILKKQIVSLAFFSIIFLVLKLLANNIFTVPVFYYCIEIIFITFVPSLRRKIKYPLFLHSILYCFAMFLPLFIVDIKIGNAQNLIGISAGIMVSILMLLSNYKHNRKYISSKNYMIFDKINFNGLFYHVFTNVYTVVGEEFFYRYFLIGFLYRHIGIYAVPISAAVFVYSHFINRWANKNFNLRSYIYHGITGIAFGLVFFYTRSICGCIVAHLIFNSPEFIVIFKRYTNSKKASQVLFVDYD